VLYQGDFHTLRGDSSLSSVVPIMSTELFAITRHGLALFKTSFHLQEIGFCGDFDGAEEVDLTEL
jgi:hypothetical protein